MIFGGTSILGVAFPSAHFPSFLNKTFWLCSVFKFQFTCVSLWLFCTWSEIEWWGHWRKYHSVLINVRVGFPALMGRFQWSGNNKDLGGRLLAECSSWIWGRERHQLEVILHFVPTTQTFPEKQIYVCRADLWENSLLSTPAVQALAEGTRGRTVGLSVMWEIVTWLSGYGHDECKWLWAHFTCCQGRNTAALAAWVWLGIQRIEPISKQRSARTPRNSSEFQGECAEPWQGPFASQSVSRVRDVITFVPPRYSGFGADKFLLAAAQ